MNLGDLLHATAGRHPQKTALVCGAEAVSYGELDQATTALARWFLREGLHPGDRVAIHWSNSIPAVKLFFACFKAGLIAVPVNHRLKPAEIAYLLEHSKAALCFSDPELAALAEGARGECPSLRQIYTKIPETGADQEPSLPAVDAGQPAVIIYTSGTTSRPKGATHSHASLFRTAELIWSMGADGGQNMLVITSMMHISGIGLQIVPALLCGATAILIPAFDPGTVLDAIERFQCSFSMGLPAMMQVLVEEQSRRPRDLRSLKTWFSGGDTVPLSLQERFQAVFGLPLQELYGMTEHCPICTNLPGAMRSGSVGRPLDGVEVRVVDLFGADAPAGEKGEMAVRSPANFTGYWNNPEATAAALRDGWLHTGDLVRRDGEGYFWFEGRMKEIIIRGGSNISPQEVEEALYQHPAVFEAGVVGAPHPVYGEQVVACVSLRNGHRLTGPELQDFARQRLADYKVPMHIVFLAALPRNATGKILKTTLREQAAKG